MFRRINTLWSTNSSSSSSSSVNKEASDRRGQLSSSLTPVADEDEEGNDEERGEHSAGGGRGHSAMIGRLGSGASANRTLVGTLLEVVNSGRLFDLPRVSSNQVKLYICANKYEFDAERHWLRNYILFELRSHFVAEGIDVQLVDVCQSQIIDHSLDSYAFRRHLSVMEDSYRTSLGPFAICFVGDKNGDIPLPLYIEKSEFSYIQNEALESGKDVKLLAEWYKLDEQRRHPSYALQPFSSHFTVTDHQTKLTNTDGVTKWRQKYKSLSDILHQCAEVCHREGRINQTPLEHKQNKYTHSALHQELDHALYLNASGVIVVLRHCEGISAHDEDAWKYLDISSDGSLNTVAQKNLQRIRDTAPAIIKTDRSLNFIVPNNGRLTLELGAAATCPPKQESVMGRYERQFVSRLLTLLITSIERQLARCRRVDGGNEASKAVCREVLAYTYNTPVHRPITSDRAATLPFINNRLKDKASLFHRFSDTIKNLLNTGATDNHKMALVCGVEGSGKSTMLDYVLQTAKSQIDKTLLSIIPRRVTFMNRTKTGTHLLCDICVQLALILADSSTSSSSGGNGTLTSSPEVDVSNMTRLVEMYTDLLLTFSKLGRQHLIIILDGLENLCSSPPPQLAGSCRSQFYSSSSSSNSSSSSTDLDLEWLTVTLPPRVHVIASFGSVTSGGDGMRFAQPRLEALTSRLVFVIDIPDLEETDAIEMIHDTVAGMRGVHLSEDRVTNAVNRVIASSTPRPFYLNIVLHDTMAAIALDTATGGRASTARSRRAASAKTPASSIQKLIATRFKLLEKRHSRRVMAQIARYLSCARNGLPETELIDLLSSNLSLLQSSPSSQDHQCYFFPFDVWFDIRLELGEMLEERYLDNKIVFCWAHRCVAQAAAKRYHKDPNDIKRDHGDIANYFLELSLLENEKQEKNSHDDSTVHMTLSDGQQQVLNGENTDPNSNLQGSNESENIVNGDTNRNSESEVVAMPVRNGQYTVTSEKYFQTPQPLLYSETMYNQRRISELWYQLLCTGDIERLKAECFCNFEYLLATVHSTTVHGLVGALELFYFNVLDADVDLIRQAVIKSVRVLSTDPLQLASELIGRLLHLKDAAGRCIAPLVKQCTEWCDSCTLPLLIPLNTWLEDPRAPLVSCLWRGSERGVIKNCFGSNGQQVFCTTSDGVESGSVLCSNTEVSMYHVASWKHLRQFSGHTDTITCMCAAKGTHFLVTGSADATVRVWDTTTGDTSFVFSNHSGAILCLAVTGGHDGCVSERRVISGSSDQSVIVTSLKTGVTLHVISAAHDTAVTSVAINSSDTILVTGSRDGSIKTWFLEDMSLLATISDEIISSVTNLAISANNVFLLTVCEDGTVHERSLITGNYIKQITGHTGKVTSLAVTSDSVWVLIGSTDGNIYIYNMYSAALVQTYSATDMEIAGDGNRNGFSHLPITDICLSQDDRYIFSSTQYQLCIWTLVTPEPVAMPTQEHQMRITCVKISHDGKTAVTGSEDAVVKLWNLTISDFMADMRGHMSAITCVDIAGDEAFVTSASRDMSVKVWSFIMACVITDYKEHQSCVTSVHVLSDNLRVVSVEEAGVVKLWDAEHGTTQLSVTGPVGHFTLSPNTVIAVSGFVNENCVNLWRVQDGFCIQKIAHVDRITCVYFSQDSQYVITGSIDMSLKVWEAETGKLTQVLVEHDDEISCAAITYQNQFIISGSYDRRLLVWSLLTGAVEYQLIGHIDHVTCVRVTDDGSTAISGSRDGTLRVWSVYNGTLVTLFDVHHPIRDLYTTSDASVIVILLSDSTHLPILYLNNSPATAGAQVKSQSQVDISINGGNLLLPIKPKPAIETRWNFKRELSSELKSVDDSIQQNNSSSNNKNRTTNKKPSVAPLQKAMKAQQDNKTKIRSDRASSTSGGQRTASYVKLSKRSEAKDEKSNVCSIV